MDRRYPDHPRVGAAAVVWRGNQVLLVRRAKPPRQDEWSLPGGMQQLGETLHDAVRREVREETGAEIDILGLVEVLDAIFPDDTGQIEHHYTLIDYAAEWRSGEIAAGDDAADACWVSPDELPRFSLQDDTLRVIKKSAAMRGQ